MWNPLRIAALGVAVLGCVSSVAAAAAYPERPIRLIIPFSPGGGTDTFGRILAEGMQAELGQPVVAENKPGAGGNIGADLVAKSRPDGYTLLLAQDSLTTVPWLYRALSFDPMKDFEPIGIGVFMPMVLVSTNSLQAGTVKELVAYARSHPNGLSYGSPGVGTAHHLNFEALLDKTGTRMVHVPYKGAAGMNTDLASGNVQVAFTALSTALPMIKGQRIRAIAVAQKERADLLPDVPTMDADVPGYTARVWFGLSAPAGTPVAVLDRLSESLRKVMAREETKKRLVDIGYVVTPTTRDGMRRIMQDEYEKWGRLIKDLGITLEQ
ncbi:tripartite tricarboxylate transporter substrate binding protein [Pigmentiphaga sp.]|uniref:Bug family tripartite tricarboxylate transporter substrate binding protein n=1 Tax=Pigmentiphaga sp. TaxID=1977564 RepID=UPI00128D9646|nr:tripartite tricarboxylate transporter substrate binding protein [Pigmentiphaga sp.]MPS26046.1 tripartite tricarboxylate transporter substrate binding protein [Alcaligenaceae bacterium SAGV5]MPS53075.1 tripartite tricarboxylate transporter substrate binding protein [Alcaligenaceae bacterium SAGV3]MPT57634.1 tripartite tricarboxylate transporter substrate binding protein [Alcaligenaceae bacterium]